MKERCQNLTEDIKYFVSSNIVAADGSSQSSNEAFVVKKMQSTWFYQYPDSAVEGLITMPYSAYLD